MDILVRDTFEFLTANGGSDGYVQVADATQYAVGAKAILYSSTQDGKDCIITDILGTTKVGLRFVRTYPTYGRDNLSAYLVADGAFLSMESQTVRVQDQPPVSLGSTNSYSTLFDATSQLAYQANPDVTVTFIPQMWSFALEGASNDAQVAISFDGTNDAVVLTAGGLDRLSVPNDSQSVWIKSLAGTTVTVRVMAF